MIEPKLHDFGAYYNAAVRWLDGAPLYRTTREVPGLEAEISGEMPWLYPPIFVLIFVPFTILPPIVAGFVWNLLTLMFLIWSVSQLLFSFNIYPDRKVRILIYLSVVSFGPTITWMKAGQVSGLLVGFLCLSGASLRPGHQWLSGIFCTLSSAFKPFYATTGTHLLCNRRRLLSATISGITVVLIGLLIFGIRPHMEYLTILFEGKGWGMKLVSPDNWAADHFEPFYILGSIQHLPRLILVIGVIGMSLYANNAGIPIEYVFALGVAIIPLAGPTTNTLALNAVIPTILMIGLYEREKKQTFPKIIAVCAILIHIHPYTIEFVSKLGPQIYSPLTILTPVIPLLQPAIYGMGILLSYTLYRFWNPIS
jgi:hypothetical protein